MASNGVSISAMEYGRSQSGMTNLKTDFEKDMNAAIAAVKDYSEIEKAVKAVWSGTDADAFVTQFKAEAEKVADNLQQFSTKVAEALENDMTYFQSEQSRNAGNIMSGIN